MNNLIFKLLLCLIFYLKIVNSAKILVLYVHDERSHLYSMAPFLKRLSEDGHHLTIFDSCDDQKPANLGFNSTIIHTYLPRNEAFEEMISTFIWKSDPHSAVLGLIHATGDESMGELLLDASEKFVELFKHEYDLVIVDEIFTIHGMTITKILKELSGIPYIIFTTSNVGAETNVAEFSMGHTPVIDATHGTILPSGHGDIYDPKIFWLRVYNSLEALGEYAAMYNYNPLVVKYQNPGKLMTFSFSTHEINRMAEMNLRESLDKLGRIAPIAEDFRGIGSHCKKVEKLSKEFADFVEDSTSKGTIYIAFGSIVNFDRCPQFVFDAFFKALNQFPDYRIIFSMKKLKSRSLPKLNHNVKLVHWAPQNAILAHSKTVLFMSHGGLKSYKEALCTKVPVVFLPILAEQGSIARMSMKMGIGTAISKYTLTADKIVDAFNRKKDEELKNAILDLSKELDLLAVHIDNSANKIIAHQGDLHFQNLITAPAKKLKGQFLDYMISQHDEDLQKLKTLCKHNMPTAIFDLMNESLEKNSDAILLSHEYSDVAFSNYQAIYTNLVIELMPVHFVCEKLNYKPRNPEVVEDPDVVLTRHSNKIEKRVVVMSGHFRDINLSRARKVWKLMPNKLIEWYSEYKKLNDGRDIQHNFARTIAHRLNEDYAQLGYDYAFGVMKNKAKNIHFGCHETACHYKREKDFVVWVLRTKPCLNTNANMITRASTCLQFEMLLYARFNAEFKYKDITAVTEMLQRNCRIRNLIGFSSFNLKLNSSISGGGRKANIFPNSRNRVPYRILTEQQHIQFRWKKFDDMQFWSDCKNENREPFNFINEYCTPESAWPTCRLTERAFQFHRLKDGESPYTRNQQVPIVPYEDRWALQENH